MTLVGSKAVRILGDGSAAYSSLACSVSFWILLALSFVRFGDFVAAAPV
jgi:hypothetical protein